MLQTYKHDAWVVRIVFTLPSLKKSIMLKQGGIVGQVTNIFKLDFLFLSN